MRPERIPDAPQRADDRFARLVDHVESSAHSRAEALEVSHVEQLTDAQVERLTAALGRGRVASLSLYYGRLSAAGVATLASGLPRISLLESLDLDHCGVDDSGAAALAAALPECRRLRHLHLDENRVGDAGAAALARALPSCFVLTRVCIVDNRVGRAGLSALAAAIPLCASLRELYAGDASGAVPGTLARCLEVDRLALVAWLGAGERTPAARLLDRGGDGHCLRLVAGFLF